MITVIVGPMFSGKTTELCRRLEWARLAGKRVVLLRPEIDQRGFLTHNNFFPNFDMLIYNNNSPLIGFDATRFDIVGIDEGQFFHDLAITADIWANKGLHVIVSGLLLSSEGQPFMNMLHLVATAEEIIKLTAVCQRCGKEASFTYYRGGRKTEQILVGGAESYEALCRDCYNSAREKKAELRIL